jgi:signal transduction histidine kinase
MREGKPMRLARISSDPRRVGFPPHHPPMESFLGVPVSGRSQAFGNLYLTEKIGAPEFTEEDERIAVMLASYAATAVETARLIERREALLGQLQTMQRQRDQFFAMVNHELRNSLTGVYGWAEQLQRARSPEAAERASREVFECAERTFTLLNNLLDLSRLDAGKSQPLMRPVRLGDRIATAVASVGPAAEKKQITVTTEGPIEGIVLRTDPVKLEQILVNLLTNAIRHSPAADTVVLRVERLGREVLINVIDRGPGISQDDQHRIFEMYVRVDPESGLGSGLGLPVSRRLAELLGGRLSVASDLGRGATFTLALPLDAPAP